MVELANRGLVGSLWASGATSFAQLEPETAQLAYLQAYAFIEFLARRHGEDSLRRLTKTLVRKRNLERAFSVTFGSDLDVLTERFASEYGS